MGVQAASMHIWMQFAEAWLTDNWQPKHSSSFNVNAQREQ